ncbi:MAG: hypothetical protein KDK76_00080 [Chlamydiia bacterium]|nr:hypothetical protein [Chlamydiia bacterium]
MKTFAFICSLLCWSVLFGVDYIADISPAIGTQQRAVLDLRIDLEYSSSHVTLIDIKGGVGSTNGMYTPRSSRPFYQFDVGFIQRYTPNSNQLFGGYLFWEKLKTPYDHYYSRVAIGAEYFINSLRGYLNGYVPLGKMEKLISGFGLSHDQIKIRRNQVYLDHHYQTEVLPKCAFELGFQKTFSKGSMTMRGFFHPKSHLVSRRGGGAVDLSYFKNRHFSIDTSLGYDSYYKAMAWIGLSFKLGSAKAIDKGSKNHRMFPVKIQEFFWTQRKSKTKTSLIVPWVYFLDSSQSAQAPFPQLEVSLNNSGSGTFEDPFTNVNALNQALPSQPNAVSYFYYGSGVYTDFDTIELSGTQSITGQGGNWSVNGHLILPGYSSLRPMLAKTLSQETNDQPLITLSDTHVIENIGLMNISGNVATGKRMIVNKPAQSVNVKIQNIYSGDKVVLDFSSGTHSATISYSEIYAIVFRTRNEAVLQLSVDHNTLQTNKDIAVRFNQIIAASMFVETLNNSTIFIDKVTDNHCFNKKLNNNAHLGYGFLCSQTSKLIAANGVLRNISDGKLPSGHAGSILFQGVDSGRPKIEGCFGNLATPDSQSDDIELLNCDINIKLPGIPPTISGLSQANNNTKAVNYGNSTITNTGTIP